MMSTVIILLVSVFFICSGWFLTYQLGKITLIERMGIAFLLGNGLTTFFWFLLYLCKIPLDLLSLLASSSLAIILGLTLNKLFQFRYESLSFPKLNFASKSIMTCIGLLLVISFLIGSYKPLIAWDSIALYDFRGHTIALNHSLKDLTDDSYYVSYPLLISLDHAIVYMLKGVSAQGMHAIIFTAFIAVVFGRLASFSGVFYALVGSLLIILNKEIFSHSTYAYTNLPYITYLITSILYAVTPTRTNRSISFLFVAGILAGLSTWVRSTEIFWLIPFALILFQGWYLSNLRLALASITFGYLIRTTWTSFFNLVITQINYPKVPLLGKLSLTTIPWVINNIPVYYWYLYLNVITPYAGMWIMLVPLTIIFWQKRDIRLLLLISSIIFAAIIVILGTIVLSTYFPTWNEIGDSARRMMLFLVPLAISASVYGLSLFKKEK